MLLIYNNGFHHDIFISPQCILTVSFLLSSFVSFPLSVILIPFLPRVLFNFHVSFGCVYDPMSFIMVIYRINARLWVRSQGLPDGTKSVSLPRQLLIFSKSSGREGSHRPHLLHKWVQSCTDCVQLILAAGVHECVGVRSCLGVRLPPYCPLPRAP